MRVRTGRLAIAMMLPLVAACATTTIPVVSGSGTSAASPTRTLQSVSLALDWTPNTNHTGFYVAQQLGYYAAAGIKLRILPYNSTAPETLVGAGTADFGISFQDTFSYSRAAGVPITSVMAILQHMSTVIGVRADSGITSPAQLDGKTYAGFGTPAEVPGLQYVIRAAGGKGTFRSVTLNTSAYDAVYSGQADFAEPFATWEVIDAQLRGKPLRTFRFQDYGFPDRYDVILIGGTKWLAGNSDLATRFVAATARGFEYAAIHPVEAAKLLIAANPGVFSNPELVQRSAALLASSYYLDASGNFGRQTQTQWQGYTDFLFRNKLLVDDTGKPLTITPDITTWFTNQYLGSTTQ
jgi:ABC-type nitrate/sulfonate/bicarbonate transport system substrate-binding protein